MIDPEMHSFTKTYAKGDYLVGIESFDNLDDAIKKAQVEHEPVLKLESISPILIKFIYFPGRRY